MKLEAFLSETGITNAAFGRQIGRDASSVSRLRRGETRPDWETAAKIAQATNGAVTANDFMPDLLGADAPAHAEAS